ncbi:sensor histidine kinase/response regulator LuxN [Vibrio maritimus]|uniref:Sensor histidine kinase/response regulator LuxN n=1 Tax=Vibrio maritimus TaxID=990268 RepID=A0A090RNW2_9VIBR|nr:sensor histidine kinase/response regulator LuxN [Vibrio maritimus]
MGNQSSEEIKELHQALNESKRAVLSGTRFIDAMLAEIRGDTLKSELFSLHSASELTISAINDFSFNKPENRQRVSLTLEDFVFWGDDTLFSFVIFNLLKNATYYFEQYPESKIDIKLSRGKTANTLLVTDYGLVFQSQTCRTFLTTCLPMVKTRVRVLDLPIARE